MAQIKPDRPAADHELDCVRRGQPPVPVEVVGLNAHLAKATRTRQVDQQVQTRSPNR